MSQRPGPNHVPRLEVFSDEGIARGLLRLDGGRLANVVGLVWAELRRRAGEGVARAADPMATAAGAFVTEQLRQIMTHLGEETPRD